MEHLPAVDGGDRVFDLRGASLDLVDALPPNLPGRWRLEFDGAAARCFCVMVRVVALVALTSATAVAGPQVIEDKAVEVVGIDDAVQLATSEYAPRTCARRASGHVVCWGGHPCCFGDAMTCGAGAGVLACTDGKDRVFHAPAGAPTRAWRGMNGRSTWRCFEVAHKIRCEQSFAGRRGEGTSVAPERDFGNLDGALDLALPSNEIDTTCVVRTAGTVECRANTDPRGQFEPIPSLTDVVALRLGCALRRAGTVACWDEATRKRDAITPVAGVTDAVELVAGDVHHCVRRKTGHVACWGYIGMLGDGRP
jgi:hypothetical protein